MPNFLRVLSTCAINPKANNVNCNKTSETLKPSIVNVAGSLLFCHNQKYSAIQAKNMLMLRRGKANKLCINRFQKLHMSLGHQSLLNKQLILGQGYQKPVLDMSDDLKINTESLIAGIEHSLQDTSFEFLLENEDNITTRFLEEDINESFFETPAVDPSYVMLDDSDLNVSQCSQTTEESVQSLSYLPRWEPNAEEECLNESMVETVESTFIEYDELNFQSKFIFVGDNVDIRTKRRQYMINKGNIDRHLYNLIAVKNRVPVPKELIGIKTTKYKNVKDIPLSFFLPTYADEENLQSTTKNIVLADLMKYFPEFSWMKKYVTKHIPHKYSEDMKKVSEVVPLGILDCNEATTDGMIKISRFQHELVPGNASKTVLRTLSFGDLLTVERQQNVQENLRDSSTSSTRLEGLTPAIADFHAYGNFMEVIWHLLYDPSSAADIGTLFQSRNFLNARSVCLSPMKELNACEDLLLKYADALFVSSFRNFLATEKLALENQNDDEENKVLIDQVLTRYLKANMLPEVQGSLSQSAAYECHFCKKSYKRMKALREHIKKDHRNSTPVKDNIDCVLNYSKTALSLCLLVKNFLDARRHGDGQRISILYKFLMLYFKLDGRTKYAYQSLHFLSQVSFLLPPAMSHELIWNRFINTKGHIDSNVEVDRHLEHRNKSAKAELGQFQGKITTKSINRASRSYQNIQNILDVIDSEILLEKGSGKHTKIDSSEDVLRLAEQFDVSNIFSNFPGRYHSKFPGFPANYLSRLNLLDLKRWIYRCCDQFSDMNIYKNDDIVICEK